MAFVMCLLFGAIALGGRMILQYRLTGDHGIRPPGVDSPRVEKVASRIFLLAFGGGVVLASLAYFDLYHAWRPGTLSFVFPGVTICLVGICLVSYSQFQMGASWRIGVDGDEVTELVTRGLYSRIRNPIYTGVFLFEMGLFLILPGALMAILVVMVVVAVHLQVRFVEEPYLRKHHGKRFEEYRRMTGTYWPKPGKGFFDSA
jgi:protein-S-isoprenylcysteine O-methyltransferase Ste14